MLIYFLAHIRKSKSPRSTIELNFDDWNNWSSDDQKTSGHYNSRSKRQQLSPIRTERLHRKLPSPVQTEASSFSGTSSSTTPATPVRTMSQPPPFLSASYARCSISPSREETPNLISEGLDSHKIAATIASALQPDKLESMVRTAIYHEVETQVQGFFKSRPDFVSQTMMSSYSSSAQPRQSTGTRKYRVRLF